MNFDRAVPKLGLLFLGLLLLALVGVVAPAGLVVVLIVVAVIGIAVAGIQSVLREAFFSKLLLPFGLFVLWAATSALWAPDGAKAVETMLKVTSLCVLGLLLVRALQALRPRDRHGAENTLVAGWLLGFAALGVGYFYALITGRALWGQYAGDPFTTLSRGQIVLIVLLWPVVGALWRRGKRLAIALIVLAALLSTVVLRGHAAMLGLLVGAGVFTAVMLLERPGLHLAALAAVLLTVAAPALVAVAPSGDTLFRKVGFVVPSAVHRAYTWHFTVDRILDHPIRGWGMEASRRIPGGDAIIVPATKDLRDASAPPWQEVPGQSLMSRSEYMPLHPHSIPLQIWLELGLPGIGLMAWIVLLVFLGSARNCPVGLADATRAGAATSFIVIGSLSFSAWQNWWIALGWLTAALMSMVVIERETAREPAPSRSA